MRLLDGAGSEIVEVDTVRNDLYLAVFLVRDGLGVGLGNDGEGVEDAEGIVFGGAQHLELIVQYAAPEAFRLLHASLGVEGEGILEVHHLLERESGNQGDGADHLVVDDVGREGIGHLADGAAGTGGVPIAHLEGFGTEVVSQYVEVGRKSAGGHDGNALAVGFEGGALLGGHLGMRHREEVDFVVLGELDNLVVGTELVTFVEGVWEPGEDD